MKNLAFILVLFISLSATSQVNKFDSTMKNGKVGYRVICKNKLNNKNSLRVKLIGFEETKDEIDIDIKGKVVGAEVDDLNKDGYPDLVVYIITDDAKRKGTVFAIASNENKGILPILFPSISENEKLKVGYDGNDQFQLINGVLSHKFAVADSTATKEQYAVARQVLYNVIKIETAWKFTVLRSIEIPRP
ncbi:MAG TPA: hypothetical protein PLU36_05510 [Chitinophagaceae bacterium]|nr:hypothetical protein [Chitinophagaceae bacterium]HMZ46241.1 hypothetical protein [Chitinophagaceae bacterium]HNE93972.1 hypothetical protein [Chitinophagaceae bacterium]HNF29795.1 hypothetical protein [Chitinophagaceae bacterium]HNM33559.1 hypothetical protein [Chitinophagaceae bacterium]